MSIPVNRTVKFHKQPSTVSTLKAPPPNTTAYELYKKHYRFLAALSYVTKVTKSDMLL